MKQEPTIADTNLKIAKFIGWSEDIPKVWFKDGKKVYRQHCDEKGELPFHKDWNHLVDAIKYIEKHYMDNSANLNEKVTVMLDFRLESIQISFPSLEFCYKNLVRYIEVYETAITIEP